MTVKREAVSAFHEAGHTVIARRLGLSVPYVVLLPTDDAEAHTPSQSAEYLARNADVATRVAAIENDILVVLAGPIAEFRRRPTKSRAGWGGDYYNLRSRLAKAVLLERGAPVPDEGGVIEVTLSEDDVAKVVLLFERLCERAKTLVDGNWPAITRVAEALLVRRFLNQDDIDELIAGTTEEANESGETAHEAFMKLISGDPRFQPAKPSDRAFIIGGAKPSAK